MRLDCRAMPDSLDSKLKQISKIRTLAESLSFATEMRGYETKTTKYSKVQIFSHLEIIVWF